MRLFGPVAVSLLYFSAVLLLSEVRFKEMGQGVAAYLKPPQHSNLHKNGDLFASNQKTFILQNMFFFQEYVFKRPDPAPPLKMRNTIGRMAIMRNRAFFGISIFPLQKG